MDKDYYILKRAEKKDGICIKNTVFYRIISVTVENFSIRY